MNGQSNERGAIRLGSGASALLVAVAVVAVGLAVAFLIGGGSGSNDPAAAPAESYEPFGDVELPDYVLAAGGATQAAYQFAVDRPDVMVWMPCYCGCGGHSGHKSALNCFIQEGSTSFNMQYDSHGASCDVCINIALDTKRMTEEGRSLRAIRDYIDSEYSSVGPGTDTPLPLG